MSVVEQDYNNIEYVIVDGGSTDGTIDLIKKYNSEISVFISEKDHGIYDAINKGITICSGDIVGILNSDDVFASNNVLSQVAKSFINEKTEALIGNIAFIKDNFVKRVYKSNNWNPNMFAWGFMPPHPSFYCKRELFIKHGLYRTDLKIASDFELLIRYLKINKLFYTKLNITMVHMSLGGISTRGINSTFRINKEIKYSCMINGIYTNYFMLYLKYAVKIFEFLNF